MTLLADVNHLGSQKDLVSNWEPAHNLVEDAISGAEIAPCLPALAVNSSRGMGLWWGDGPDCSQLALLWYSFLCGKVLSLSLSLFSLRLSYSLGCYLKLAPSDCPQSIQARSSTEACNHHLLVQPRSLVADASIQAGSPLEVAVRHIICGVFKIFPPSVMLPSEIPKLPTVLPVTGFPGIWKLLLFHDSLPGTGLLP